MGNLNLRILRHDSCFITFRSFYSIIWIQVNLPNRHFRVTATSDIRQLSELPIEIFDTKLPPSSGNLREAAQIILPMGAALGDLPVYNFWISGVGSILDQWLWDHLNFSEKIVCLIP